MRKGAAILLLLLLASCDEDMDRQNRFKTYGAKGDLQSWPAEGEALPLVKGTVAQNSLERESAIAIPPPVSPALLQEGHDRYDIYCSPCHGLTGAGDGIVVARGFPKPKPFSDPGLMQASANHIVDVIGQGQGVMYSFSDRVEAKDRWAIVAYIRALQSASADGGAKP